MQEQATENFPEIESVNESALGYIRKKYLLQSVILIILAVVILVFSIRVGNLALAYLIPILLFFGYTFVEKKILRAFMQQFAEANGYQFAAKGSLEEVAANYLQMGHSRHMDNVVSGKYAECPIRFFDFGCTVGYGRNSRRINFSSCEITYNKTLHKFFLDAKVHNFLFENLWANPHTGEEKLSLEGDFNKYFTLYVSPGCQVEALEIFTPDIMEKLIDLSQKFSLEFVGDKLYIYTRSLIKKREDLYAVFKLAKFLVSELAPKLERME